jgi:hypothetical protein
VRAHSTSAGAVSQATWGARGRAPPPALPHVAAQHRASAEGDDARLAQRGLEHLDDDVALDSPEHVLAARGEDLGDGAFALHDERIGVHERYLQTLGGKPPRGALPGGHEADQSDRVQALRAVLEGFAHRLRQ